MLALGSLGVFRPLQVGPGEVLYLPSMWYHQVGQREAPAAVRQQQQQPYGSTRQQCGKSAAEAQGTDGEARVEDGRAAEEEEEGAASTEDGEQEYVIAVNYWWVCTVRRTARLQICVRDYHQAFGFGTPCRYMRNVTARVQCVV